jgi:hypothetical protein
MNYYDYHNDLNPDTKYKNDSNYGILNKDEYPLIPSRQYPSCNRMFFYLKNSSFEIYVMWFLLIATIIIILSLVVGDADDRYETERVL